MNNIILHLHVPPIVLNALSMHMYLYNMQVASFEFPAANDAKQLVNVVTVYCFCSCTP